MAIPFINAQYLMLLSQLNVLLGGDAWQNFSDLQLVFVQMLGILGTAWAIWRWKNISIEIGRFEGVLRYLYSASLFWAYITIQQPIILVFAVVDVIAGMLHLNKCEDK